MLFAKDRLWCFIAFFGSSSFIVNFNVASKPDLVSIPTKAA
jgi:hypothetical protein